VTSWLSGLGSRVSAGTVAAALLVVVPATAQSQQRLRDVPARQVPANARPRAAAQSESLAPGRARLEAEVRRNFAQLVRRGVGLSDPQMRRLVPVTQRYEQQRRLLQREEREARLALRQQLRDEQTADARQVDLLMQKLVDVQKRRVGIFEAEQRELGEFMTPIQRAKFTALQDQIRRRLEQMRQRRVP
jgi:hypothetical protein